MTRKPADTDRARKMREREADELARRIRAGLAKRKAAKGGRK